MRLWQTFILTLCALSACSTTPEPRIVHNQPDDLILSGQLTHADLATYKEIAFTVPPGVESLAVTVEHDGRDQRTTIDLGLIDPAGLRGWSGGNKQTLFVSAFEATPSYRAGPILPGRWKLLFGIPAIREGVTTNWKATVTFNARARLAAEGPQPPPAPSPGWRRGDFHAHTGHSDGSCEAQSGKRVPCPVHLTLDAAVRAKLDFIAVTDHNTWAQNQTLSELAPFYDKLTVIHGAEITTFLGHANALGVRAPTAFRLNTPALPDLETLLTRVAEQGGILSLNHPGVASGETCLGCGWTAASTDPRIRAVEVVNGGSIRANTVEGPTSGILYWQKMLDAGMTVTAIGGSDNHDPTVVDMERQSPVGRPATVVWAADSSEAAIIDGVRNGRVFIDLDNVPGRILDVRADAGAAEAPMGGTLMLRSQDEGRFFATTAGMPPGSRLHVVSGGLELLERPAALRPNAPEDRFVLKAGARHGWIRAEVRDREGRLIALSNPVYIRRAD